MYQAPDLDHADMESVAELPAHFAVWLCSPEAEFVKGRFLWAAWDVDELKKKQDVIEKNPEQLMVGHTMDKLVEATG